MSKLEYSESYLSLKLAVPNLGLSDVPGRQLAEFLANTASGKGL